MCGRGRRRSNTSARAGDLAYSRGSRSSAVGVGASSSIPRPDDRDGRDAAAKRARDAAYARTARGTGGTFGVADEQ